MKPLSSASAGAFASVRFVLTDMDDTLTHRGRLPACAYDALERLQGAGMKVIPVTAAPAGWCDQMARMWPVDGVIAENGGVFLRRNDDGGVKRLFLAKDADLAAKLDALAERVLQATTARLADDQPFRLTSVAFERPREAAAAQAITAVMQAAGASTTLNNLWALGWFGAYDKLVAARAVMAAEFGLDIDRDRDAVLYCGDSANDAPMFSFFAHTVGVSTVRDHLTDIPVPPRWITQGPGGAGFVEAADTVIACRARYR